MNLIVQVFTVVAIGAAGLSSASAAPVSAEEPPKLVKTGAGTFVPDFPGTPLPVYELEFANPEDWPGEELLRNHLPALNAPESLEILSINPERRKVLLRTTRFAARSGFSSIGGTLRLVEDAGPEIQCARIYANLNLEETPREGDPR